MRRQFGADRAVGATRSVDVQRSHPDRAARQESAAADRRSAILSHPLRIRLPSGCCSPRRRRRPTGTRPRECRCPNFRPSFSLRTSNCWCSTRCTRKCWARLSAPSCRTSAGSAARGEQSARVDFVDWTCLGDDLAKTLVCFIDVAFELGRAAALCAAADGELGNPRERSVDAAAAVRSRPGTARREARRCPRCARRAGTGPRRTHPVRRERGGSHPQRRAAAVFDHLGVRLPAGPGDACRSNGSPASRAIRRCGSAAI